MNEYDARQYERMLDVIRSSKPTIKSLGKTIGALEGLIDQITDGDHDWIEKFRSEWWRLEYVYSLLLANERLTLEGAEIEDISQTLKNLENQIQSRLRPSS